MEQVWVAVDDDDRDKHEDSSTNHAEHKVQDEAPGPEN